ncbi:MAG: alpha-1,2-fucosyltransferase [Polyangiaceae bacterium]
MRVVYPQLSHYDLGLVRVIGPGLGNLLFPWARAITYAERHDLPILFPTWPQVKIGSVLRRERDTRFYWDLFRSTSRYVTGTKRLALLATGKRVSWSLDKEPPGKAISRPSLLTFTGMEGHFEAVLDDYALIRRELEAMSRQAQLQSVIVSKERWVGVHVRLGDFTPPPSEQTLQYGHHNYRIPLEWYVDRLEALRSHTGITKALVFSDGTNAELEPLLSLPHVSRSEGRSSLADMLSLARCNALVASGSTFSMWASFLGRMPVIWYPGQLRQRLYKEGFELESARGAALPGDFSSRQSIEAA